MPLIKTSFFSLQIHFYIPFSFVGQIQNLFEKFIESHNLGRIQKMIWMESNRLVMSIVRCCCCSVFVIVVMFWVQREEREEGGEKGEKRQNRSNYYFLGLLMLILFRRHESPLLLASIREFSEKIHGGWVWCRHENTRRRTKKCP